jgi:transposase
MIHIDFDAADYLPCPVRERCTRARTDAGACSLAVQSRTETVQSRTETVQSRTEWEALVTCRARQQTPEFAARYVQRAGIEGGALSQGVRAFDLRQARYRGLAKTQLHNVATATAIDLTRLADWLGDVPRAATRRSRFAR